MDGHDQAERRGLPPFALGVRAALAGGSRRVHVPGAARAGVLVALFPWQDAPHVWLIRRPEGLRSHAGQVALPGGKVEPEDADITATALREASEEIGLPPSALEVLGLDDDFSTSTGYVITPVVAWLVSDFTLATNPAEVARAFSAPLAIFREEGILGIVPIEAFKNLARAYLVDGEIVWGATARVLRALALRIDFSPPVRSSDQP
jgi:8-oxo-dGTP pyrophosphatase MutT (NUDIX family)